MLLILYILTMYFLHITCNDKLIVPWYCYALTLNTCTLSWLAPCISFKASIITINYLVTMATTTWSSYKVHNNQNASIGFISQHSSNCHYILLSISEYHGSPNFIALNSIQGTFSKKWLKISVYEYKGQNTLEWPLTCTLWGIIIPNFMS